MGLNKLVDFTTAKLLKEKGFDIPSQRYYEHALTSKKDSETNDYTRSFGWKKGEINLQYGFFRNNGGMADLTNENWYMCSAPIIAEVLMWLYEKHGIWISISMENNEEDNVSFYFSITVNVNNETYFRIRKSNFNSPTEAYAAAIEYVLKTLI